MRVVFSLISLLTFASLPTFLSFTQIQCRTTAYQKSFVPDSIVMMEHTINNSNLSLEALNTSTSSELIHLILDRGPKFLLNLLHNKLSWLCTLHSTTTHFDDGAPIWLLILIWTMSGESELTPTPELYRYNGEDVVWTWRLGKASASFWELSSLHMRKYNSEDPLVNTLF